MLEYVKQHLASAEKDPRLDTRAKVFEHLRALGLSDFGQVMVSMPSADFPRLSSLLPRMASRAVQEEWTGSSGFKLLGQTVSFASSASYNYARLAGKSLSDASILDFGCGYGRIARLMYYFTGEDQVFGCDPWGKSIEICKQDGLGNNFLQSDYLPESLPLGARKFAFIYSFSVFTHLSERATRAALSTLRKYIADDGLLVITIRPVEFWEFRAEKFGAAHAIKRREHEEFGFAFRPHGYRAAVDGDITYGDTSLSLDWLKANCPDWELAGIDRALSDLYQVYVFLKPRPTEAVS